MSGDARRLTFSRVGGWDGLCGLSSFPEWERDCLLSDEVDDEELLDGSELVVFLSRFVRRASFSSFSLLCFSYGEGVWKFGAYFFYARAFRSFSSLRLRDGRRPSS